MLGFEPKFWSDIGRRRSSAFKLANETNRREPKQSRIPDEQILSSAYAFVGPNTAPNSGRILAHRSPRGTGGSNPPRSAIESFSICNSARDDRNTRLRGRFRIACGSGERSEPRIRPFCGSFYPQKPDSGPRRKWAGPGGIRRPRSIALRIAQLLSGTGLSQTENVGRDGEWQSP